MSILTERELSTLSSGELIVAGDGRYDAARAVWNGCIDRRPRAVVRCRSVRDVAETVKATVRLGVPLAVRGGGHGAPGFSTCDDGIVLDVSLMNNVEIDAGAKLFAISLPSFAIPSNTANSTTAVRRWLLHCSNRA